MASKNLSQQSAGSSLHRNLFNQVLGRKIPAPSLQSGHRTAQPFEDVDSDILIRDERGNYQLEQPMLTPTQRNEQKDDIGQLNGKQYRQ